MSRYRRPGGGAGVTAAAVNPDDSPWVERPGARVYGRCSACGGTAVRVARGIDQPLSIGPGTLTRELAYRCLAQRCRHLEPAPPVEDRPAFWLRRREELGRAVFASSSLLAVGLWLVERAEPGQRYAAADVAAAVGNGALNSQTATNAFRRLVAMGCARWADGHPERYDTIVIEDSVMWSLFTVIGLAVDQVELTVVQRTEV